ncbi:phage holin family protein [Cytobacillus kochii]|uniref:phage holin family protein n=1 Tax=Cytobacillus kochii TaxID=859143 RepID=UPI001CD66EAF|nr:phage holin family protein [Cytobacillus kochii]MCA1025795.1 phage holin family protein [Cytobacillus kochii]
MFKLGIASTAIGVPLSFIFGDWTPLMGVLMVLTALDIITGIAKGFYDKGLRSRKMSQGMVRKGMIFVVIILANMIDVAMASTFNELPIAKMSAITFYLGMEGLSIVENLAQMNMPMPAFVKNYLLVLKENGENVADKKTFGKK